MRRTLSILFTAAPFVAAAVAALSARHDMRMLWMAAVATLVARLVTAATPRIGGARALILAFALATAAAVAVAVGLGAHGVFGVVAVAIVLAGCAAVGAALGRRSRPSAPTS